MKTVLIGLGRQGYRILELLLQAGIDEVDIFDIQKDRILKAEKDFGKKVRPLEKNPLALEAERLVETLAEYGLVLDALPSTLSYRLMRAAVEAGTKMVSVSFLEEDFMSLDKAARKTGSLVIPDCGGAPGFSHMMAGYSVNALRGAEKVIMKVGAIPAVPEPPFFHSLTWSVEDLLEEYFRPAKCRKNGIHLAPDPFEDIEEENIQGLPLQSFLSDGARSFLANYPKVAWVEERTLRHHGHMDFMKPFQEVGFLSRDAVTLGNQKIPAFQALAAMLEKSFPGETEEDRFVMQVEIFGKNGTHRHEYNMPFNREHQVFGLVNSVAVTAVEAAAMILDGTIDESGILPLELLGQEERFARMSGAHRDQGAMVTLEMKSVEC